MVEPYQFIYWKGHDDYKDTSKKNELFREFASSICKDNPSINITGKFNVIIKYFCMHFVNTNILFSIGPQVKKLWDDVFEDCKSYFAREKNLKSGSGSDFGGPSSDKYSIDIYEKMRFITKFLYDSDGDVFSTMNSSNLKNIIWKRQFPNDTNQKKPKTPKVDRYAEEKLNEKAKLTDILSKLLDKFDDMADRKSKKRKHNPKFDDEDSDEEEH